MLTNYFKEILDNYLNSISNGKFNKNHEMFKLINYTTTNAVNEIAKKYNLIAKGSCGAGGWTRYPWIAIYNDKITTTIQRGVYIVYLFSQDMSRVYLTLNQGCTNLKKELGTKAARDLMINTRENIRSIIDNYNFNTDNELIIGNIDYEIGSIFYREYLADEFPQEEEFIKDLEDMISVYEKYYKLIFLKGNESNSEIQLVHMGDSDVKDNIIKIESYIKSRGFIFSYEDLCNFYLSLKTKPFVILAGISGTGKSKLTKLFSEAINATSANNGYHIISVKPDWNDSTELFGYKDINNRFIPGQLTKIMEEASRPENMYKPYFICLDEMNLARVEYYLSEYLSILESRCFHEDDVIRTDKVFPNGYLSADSIYKDLIIPENIYIIGTVNMDDTTFSFSRKVLDRANTIEFNDVRLEVLDFELLNLIKPLDLDNSFFKTKFISIKDAIAFDKDYVVKINNQIIEINNILAMGNKHFGYRVRDQIIFYMLENKENKLLDESLAFDYQIMQKILPTITGSDRVIKDILIELYNYCNLDGQIIGDIDYINYAEENLETALYPKSANKILMMLRGYEDGFARSGNRSKLIEIIANNYSLVITGDVERNKSKITRSNVNIPAAIIVYSYNNENVTLKTITDFGELVENSGNSMMPCFFENGRYQLILEVKEKKEYEIFLGGIRITDDFQVVGNCYIGIVDFSSDIGYTNIDIYEETKKILTVTIEIFPSKLDYFKDYKEIINEINEEVCSLAFKFIDKTYVFSKLKDVEYQTNAEFISILDVVFEDLVKSLKRIVNNFKHNVITEDRIADIHKAKKISKKSISYICKHPEILIKSNKGFILVNGEQYYSTTVIEEIKNTTIDIFENRFVKYMIQRIINRLFSIEKLLREDNPHEKHTLESIRRKIKFLESYYKRYFQNIRNLTGNKSMSLVFQMAPGYKEMYKKYSILNKGLDLGEDIYKITPKKLYDLYEIWCYIKIHKTLIDLGYQVEEYGILKYKDNGMHLSLLQDSEAKMIYKNNRNKLELWYNKSYNLPTTNQRPDTVLCITSSNVNDNRMYIFDAKYRIAIDEKGTVGPMEDDINIMHRYRDAIVSKMNDDFKYKYETFGAYVMFPYGNEEKYINHKFYNSIEEVNVGAFPMLPGSTKLITEHLDKIINQSNIEAKSKRIALDEYDDYAKFKLENVMVVNVKDKNHLDAYLKNKFYHIPIKRLSNVRLGVEYLAFYQSKKTFGDDSGIKYYAKINNVYKYSREECVEIPTRRDNKKEIYLRFELDDIKEISPIKPIQSGTQLVSYTTLYLLLNAENMHELKLNSNLEIEVYKILKNLAEENNWSIRKEYNKYLMNNNTVDIIENKRIRVKWKDNKFKGFEKELLG